MDPDKNKGTNVDLSSMGVSKEVRVKAFDECTPSGEKNRYKLVGTVTASEAKLLDNVLKLHRKETGSLSAEELPLVAHLLGLKGK
jgi:hypothetical protein